MVSAATFGTFTIRSAVHDGSGETADLSANSSCARHVVEVENWGTLPHDVAVGSRLPDHPRHLSFQATGPDWDLVVWSLAKDEKSDGSCALSFVGSRGTERIHCVRVECKKAGRHNWRPAPGPSPLVLSVRVS